MQTATDTPKKAPRAPKAAVAAKAPRIKAAAKTKSAPAKAAAPKAPKVAKAKAPAAPVAKAQTKSAKVVALLSRVGGATNKEIMDATGWQTHSVRGFLAHLKKTGVAVSKTVGGAPPTTTYRITADEAV